LKDKENHTEAGARENTWMTAVWRDAPYGEVWPVQKALAGARADGSLQSDAVLFVEHRPVFTMGRRGGTENLRVAPDFLAARGIPVYHIERGGDITYHGPGQLVVYPVVDLPGHRLKVVEFVELLEEVMIQVAADFGVTAERSPRNRGVWVGPRKLGSVGITVRRGVSFHGLALNVDADLTPFTWIHPCGLQGVAMTSLCLEGAVEAAFDRVLAAARRHVEEVFGARTEEVDLSFFSRFLTPGPFKDEEHPPSSGPAAGLDGINNQNPTKGGLLRT